MSMNIFDAADEPEDGHDPVVRINYVNTGSAGCDAGVQAPSTTNTLKTIVTYTCSGGTQDISVSVPIDVHLRLGITQTWLLADPNPTPGRRSSNHATLTLTVPKQAEPSLDAVTVTTNQGVLERGGETIQVSEGIPRVFTTTVISFDKSVTNIYRTSITRGPISITTLDSLLLSDGVELSPRFRPGHTAYTASVANSIASLTVTSTLTDSSASLTVDGTAVDDGEASAAIQLVAGVEKTILAVVTARNGMATRTYAVRATRRTASDNADLSGLVVSNAALSPIFGSATTSYTARVANNIGSVTIMPVLGEANASVHVDGAPVASGAPSGGITLTAGQPQDILVVVTAQDGATTKTYTVTAIRATSADATLSGLALSGGAALATNFSPGRFAYRANVASDISGVIVTPTAREPNATIAVNGMALSGAQSAEIPLVVNQPKDIVVVVTAQDGVATKTYTVTVTRLPSANADLSGLTLSDRAVLSPKFMPGTTSYTAGVASSVDSVTVTAALDDANATVTVDGAAAATPVALVLNMPKDIVVVVTAQDGSTTKTYTVTVTRMLSANADLSGLTLSDRAVLSPDFEPGTISYTAGVANGIASVTVTPVVADSNATVTVDGGAANTAIPLVANEPKAIVVVVTAQDGTTKTYTVTVTRALPDDAALAGLALSGGATLSRRFEADIISYTASVANRVSAVRVTPTVNQADATVTVDGSAVGDGEQSAEILLQVNTPKAIVVVVTAQDGIATKTYTVTVTRLPSANADLSGLSLSAGGAMLSLDFMADRIAYTASVESNIGGVRITPAVAEPNATLTLDGAAHVSGEQSAEIPLVVNQPKAIVVVVTAQDAATTKTYRLTVTRMPSTDATLAGLSVSAGTLEFSSATTSYAVSAPNAAAEIAITATLRHDGAAFTLQTGEAAPAAGVSGTASAPAAIAEGARLTFTIVVTAEDAATMQTYIVVVTRMPAPPEAPTGLVVTVNRNTFSLDWAAPTETHGAPISNYRVRWGITRWTSPGGNDGVSTESTDAAWALPIGQYTGGFRVQVAAETSAGVSGWLGDLDTRHRINSDIPPAPENLSVTAVRSVLQLVWDLSSGATGYEARLKADAEAVYGEAMVVPADSAARGEHMLAGLLGGTAYDVQVAAVNQHGRSSWSSASATLAANTNNADLSSLRFNDGAHALTSPFSPAATAYSVNTPNSVMQGTVTPVAVDAGAGIRVTAGGGAPAAVNSGEASAPAALVDDVDFAFGIAVTSASGNVFKTYTLTLNRTPPRLKAQQADLVFAVGKSRPVQLPAAEQGAAPYIYALPGLPDGLSLDQSSGEISGMAAAPAPAAQLTYTVTDASARSDAQEFAVRAVAFDLDLDAGGANANDGIITARYLLGVRGEFLVQGQGAPGSAAALEAELKNGVDSLALDVDGNGEVNGDDGIFTARYLLGLRGEDLVGGFAGKTAAEIERNIAELLP
ncbi:MAG: cadherin-like beta sandwich domain-containing protein [Gammaproteobacteria bacterium]